MENLEQIETILRNLDMNLETVLAFSAFSAVIIFFLLLNSVISLWNHSKIKEVNREVISRVSDIEETLRNEEVIRALVSDNENIASIYMESSREVLKDLGLNQLQITDHQLMVEKIANEKMNEKTET